MPDDHTLSDIISASSIIVTILIATFVAINDSRKRAADLQRQSDARAQEAKDEHDRRAQDARRDLEQRQVQLRWEKAKFAKDIRSRMDSDERIRNALLMI